MKPHASPQLTSAAALQQLLADHPDLPPLKWSISPAGALRGELWEHGDNTAAFAAYAHVLGGARYAVDYEYGGVRRISQYLHTTWRDVKVTVDVGSDAAAVQRAGRRAA